MNIKETLMMKTEGMMRHLEMSTEQQFLMEFNDAGELSVRGCQDLSVCNPDRILMKCRKRYIDVSGENLEVSIYSSALTSVTGKINEISILSLK